MSRHRRPVATVVVGLLVVAVVVALVGALTRDPKGPAGSSYAVGHRGASGLASLLERAGHPVARQRVPVDVELLESSDSAVVVDGDVPEPQEIAALDRFVLAGGRLVVAGTARHDLWLSRLMGEDLYRSDALLACRRLADLPETADVDEIESTGERGFFADTETAVPALGCGETALAIVAAHGAGRIVAVADPAVFQNFLLGARDNATFALAAVGGVERRIVFLEHLHGFEQPSGLAALPWRWMTAGAVLAVAGLAAGLARRGLPGDRAAIPSGGGGVRHQDALAAALTARAKDLAPLAQRAARRALARSARLPAEVDDDALRGAAARLRVSPDDVELVLTGPADQPTLLAATRVLERTAPASPGDRDA